ncbi:ketoacyl-synt-domain-containing protein, partial [Violaceomyces palustris]
MESGRTVVEEVVDEARKLVQAQLGIESSGLVADHLSLQGLGLSSSQAVRFFGTVKARHRVELDASLLFTSETFGELCRAIRASIESCKHEEEESTSSSSTPVEIEKTLPPSDSTEERIAVVGAGVRLPGGVKNVEDFWNSLVTAKGPTGEAILSPITKERRRYLGRDGDRMPSYPCGWLSGSEGVEDFDAGFFGISDEEAIHTKPQQRLLLELTYETLQDAMIPPGQLKGARVGVFIGCSNADGYDEVMRASGVDQFNKLAGGSLNQSVLCGRLSHHFDWQGPSMTIQAACSSGLNVIELAVTSLQRRECDYALVGGVTTHLGALTLSFLASAGMSSPTGTSKPFGKDSNGYVPSEGCATLLLRRLADAESSWDRIYGCIEAASSAHQGRTATMATTNSASQRRIHSSVLAKAGL